MNDLTLRVKILEQLLGILSRNDAEDLMMDIDDYAKLKNDRAYLQGKAEERTKVLKEVYQAFEEIDDCEFAMFSLCLIRETLEKIEHK